MIHYVSRFQKTSLGDKQLIALNLTDLLICCLSLANIFYFNGQAKENESGEVFSNAYSQILVSYPLGYLSCFSCFITVMLSTTRALALAKPFYNIRKRFVRLAFGICVFVLITMFAIRSLAYYESTIKQDPYFYQVLKFVGLLEMIMICVTVLVVGVNSGISIKTLSSSYSSLNESSRNDNSRKATIMILILSIVFVICNGLWSILWLTMAVFRTTKDKSEIMIGLFLNLAVILLNSSLNPVVYIMRNSALNSYLTECWMNLRRHLGE